MIGKKKCLNLFHLKLLLKDQGTTITNMPTTTSKIINQKAIESRRETNLFFNEISSTIIFFFLVNRN